ncbi:phage major tail protein, TP901-1 family [Lactococcus lactis]|uniref:phage major tail protein, TP901-1 family n=1 Tax=Lactococcus lactis TaxID=1358 RepID=UPI0024188E0B|nr:phage major tail protein, TP901-1 family [Lactococcus lactis]MDG4966259.1 phage major tail protein, TP901-1 family [Lactococcus lactis]
MTTAIKGINVFLLFRKLAEAESTEAKRLAFQTEHSRTIEADSSNTVTKDGNVNVPGVATVEMDVTSVLAQGDTLQDELEKAIIDGSLYEIWEITKTEDEETLGKAEETKKYPATYYQGYITSTESTFGAEDLTELSIGLAINGTGAKGMATVTEEQSEVIQYAFRDTDKYVPETGDNAKAAKSK